MGVNPLDKIKVARKAFEAYEKAIMAAQEVIGDGPVRGLGTTVMMDGKSGYMGVEVFKCSECHEEGHGTWKFCAFCGAQIIRFDRPEEPKMVAISVTVEEPKPQKPKSKSARA